MIFRLIVFTFIFNNLLLSQETIITTGGELNSNDINVSYTVGQLKVNLIENVKSSILKLDFIQGVQYAFNVFDCNDYNNIKIIVYPNPTSSLVNISIEKMTHDLRLVVFDVTGKEIHDESFTKNNLSLDFSSYSEGIYIIGFYNFCGLFRSFKVAVNK